MKLNFKILTILLMIILFSVIFCFSSVSAVGRVSQGWKIVREGATEPDLLFRTFTGPHESTIKKYTNTNSTELLPQEGSKRWTYITSNGSEAYSKWIYNDAIILPSKASFNILRMVFHDEMFCDYSAAGDWGYNLATSVVDYNISTINYAIENSSKKMTSPKKTGRGNEIFSITSIGGTYSYVNWGTGLVLKNVYAGKQTEYRHALIRRGNSKINIYIQDSIIYNEDLNGLISALNGSTSCYVSDELISKSYSGPYEVSKTAYDFTVQYKKRWGTSTRGTTVEGMSSAINEYDNRLIFPTYTSRKVYIKHIDIGTGETIDLNKVNNGSRITPKSNQKYILVAGTKTTSNKNYIGYEEYYEGIGITQDITKYALDLDDEELNCLGYNVGVAADLSSAQGHVSSLVRQGIYTKASTVTIDGKAQNDNDDAIVIEFYYSAQDTQNPEIPGTPEPGNAEEPPKNIDGNVFVKSSENIIGACDDTQQYSIAAIPSGSSATVGIEKIPQYMAGAINLEEQQDERTLKVYLTLAAGPNTKKVTYTLNYITTYYNVTNMLIYRFNGIEVYDANKGYSGTVGDSMFSWTRGVLTDNKLIKTPTVKLTGLNNVNIANSTDAIKNKNNYVSVILNSSLGTYNLTQKDSQSLSYTYISSTEWDKIDANKDKNITYQDKDYAAYLVEVADQAKNDAYAEKIASQKAMNEAYNTMLADEKEKEIAYELMLEAEEEFDIADEALKEAKAAKEAAETAFDDEYGVSPSKSYVDAELALMNSLKEKYEACTSQCSDEYKAYNDQKNKYNNILSLYNEYLDLLTDYNVANSYYSVREKELDTARTNYETKDVEYDSSKFAYNTSIKKYDEASDNYSKKVTEYDEAVAYEKYLVKNYDKYVTLYNEYKNITGLSNSAIASKFNISADIKVRNMQVTIDGYNLHSQASTVVENISFATNNLSSYIYNISTDKPTISTGKYSNLTKTIQRNEYTNNSYIDESVINGIRGLSGIAKYKTEVIIGASNNKVKDTVYYNNKTFSVEKGKQITKTYKVDTQATTSVEKYKDVLPINVYTPITVKSSLVIDQNEVVDQTSGGFSVPLIQINTPFTIRITNNKGESVYGFSDTIEFNKGYYIKFDFDVHKVRIDGKSYKDGQKINAGTWIGILTGEDINVTAQAYGSIEDSTLNVVSDEKSSYTVRAVAYNATDIMRNTSKLYPTLEELMNSDAALLVDNICSHPSYFAEETNDVIIINRMYGFRVTDVKDIEWKETFRTTSGSMVNKHTGNVYYSGTTKWDTNATSKVNKISNRTVSEIGRNPLRILPIGPYKNTNISKMKAPKLGYRFSYDFKVTGSYYNSDGAIRTDKKVSIKTKFYYISKDGKTFIEESNGGAGIYLFYKNSNGKYVRIDTNGGNYELKYTPQDGYRYIEDSMTETLATQNVSLGNLRNMTLRYNMATPTDNRAAITYYGEYKLPNSTIAVKVDGSGKYNINNPLTDGYIGVVFDITANAGTVTQNGVEIPVVLKYGQNTKDEANTSQWDYEGFLGFTNYGSTVKSGELAIKLEDGTWQITDEVYNKIKGTVILYDIDQRAATDYE